MAADLFTHWNRVYPLIRGTPMTLVFIFAMLLILTIVGALVYHLFLIHIAFGLLAILALTLIVFVVWVVIAITKGSWGL